MELNFTNYANLEYSNQLYGKMDLQLSNKQQIMSL